MAGVNSLGIGSGVLTADVLDQLRAADDKVILKPLEAKLELSTQKEEAYKLLDGFMSTFKKSTSTLGGESMYLGRQVSGNDDFVTVSAVSGSDLQSFNITDVVKAEKDVWNASNTFDTTTTAIPGLATGTLKVSVGGQDLDIKYNSATTLDDIRKAINDSALDATATNLKIGENAYSFSLTSDKLNQAITFSDSQQVKQLDTVTLTGNAALGDTFTWSDGVNSLEVALVEGETADESAARIASAINADPTLSALYTASAQEGSDGFTMESKTSGLDFNATVTSSGTQTSGSITTTVAQSGENGLLEKLGLNNIQQAREASFKMNGIGITRSSNDISDLINGVTISLNKNHAATDSSSINVTQNTTTIETEMDLFVTNYNTLTSNLKDMTIYNQETSTAGIFNAESSIKGISADLKNIITKTDPSGTSLYDFGVEIDRDGVMTLNSSKFSAKLSEDAAALELLFRGQSAIDVTRQQDSIKLTGNAVAGDTFEWSDGENTISVNLVDGETPKQTGARIAAAINADITLKQLYSASASTEGFTIESRSPGVAFNGLVTSTGAQTSSKETLVEASDSSNARSETIGIFKELDNKMFKYTGSNQILSNFSTQLSDSKASTIAEYDKQKEMLDVRYETMTKKFAAYDAIINKLNNQFSSLKLLIDSESNSKN